MSRPASSFQAFTSFCFRFVYSWSALIAFAVSPFASYAVARSRKPFGSVGCFWISLCAFETDTPPPPPPKMFRPLKSWSRPLEPEPTPRKANVIAKRTARMT